MRASKRKKAFVIFFILMIIGLAVCGCKQGNSTKPQKTSNKKTAEEPSLKTGAAATVNGEVIPVSEVEKQIKRIETQQKTSEEAATFEKEKQDIKKQVLDILIDEELYRQAAPTYKISVSDQEVEAEVEVMKNRFPNEEEFNKAASDAGMTLDDIKEYTRTKLITDKVNAYIIANNLASVTDAEAYMKANPDTFKDVPEKEFEQMEQAQREKAITGAWLDATRKAADIKRFI